MVGYLKLLGYVLLIYVCAYSIVERPIWEKFSKREFEFYDPYDRH